MNINNDKTKKENNIASILKCLSIVFLVIGSYGGIKMVEDEKEFLVLPIILTVVVFTLLLYAIGEIIQKLQNIENNTRN